MPTENMLSHSDIVQEYKNGRISIDKIVRDYPDYINNKQFMIDLISANPDASYALRFSNLGKDESFILDIAKPLIDKNNLYFLLSNTDPSILFSPSFYNEILDYSASKDEEKGGQYEYITNSVNNLKSALRTKAFTADTNEEVINLYKKYVFGFGGEYSPDSASSNTIFDLYRKGHEDLVEDFILSLSSNERKKFINSDVVQFVFSNNLFKIIPLLGKEALNPFNYSLLSPREIQRRESDLIDHLPQIMKNPKILGILTASYPDFIKNLPNNVFSERSFISQFNPNDISDETLSSIQWNNSTKDLMIEFLNAAFNTKQIDTIMSNISSDLKNDKNLIIDILREQMKNQFGLIRNSPHIILKHATPEQIKAVTNSDIYNNELKWAMPIIHRDGRSSDTVQYNTNINYHVLKGKFLSISQQIQELEGELQSTEVKSEKQKVKNKINSLYKQIRSLKYYNEINKILSDSEIDNILNREEKDNPIKFDTYTTTWKSRSGQQFDTSSETAIAIYWSKEFYDHISDDPVLTRYINEYTNGHVMPGNPNQPVGWALVYEKDAQTWVINQIQSDLLSELYYVYKKISGLINDHSTDDIASILSNSIHMTSQLMDDILSIILSNSQSKQFSSDIHHLIFSANQAKLINLYKLYLISPDIVKKIINEHTLRQDSDPEGRSEITLLNIFIYIDEDINTIKRNMINNDDNSMGSDQIIHIYNKLSFLVKDWYKLVFHAVWKKAKENNVQHLYMNTSETVKGGLSDSAKKQYYETYPKNLGFEKRPVNLRDKDETFWYRKASR